MLGMISRRNAYNNFQGYLVFLYQQVMSPQSSMKYSSLNSPSDKMPETLEKLVQITIEQIKALDPPEGLVPVTDAQHAGPPARSPWTKRLKDRLRPGSHQNVQHPKLDACNSASTELSDSTRAGADRKSVV